MPPAHSIASFADIGLSQFLQKNNWLQFDLEEFFISLNYSSELNGRMSEFNAALELPTREWPTEVRIRASIEVGGLSDIPAFMHLADARSLKDLPTTTKNEVRTFADRYMNLALTNELLWKKLTTGSSGPPLEIWYSSLFYYDLLFLAPRKILSRAVGEIFPSRQLFCVSVSDNQNMPNAVFVDPTCEVGLSVQAVVDGSKPATLEPVLGLIRDNRPVCIASKPSLLEILARRVANSNQADLMECHIISSGSALTPELRARLRMITKGSVIDAYAMTEFGLVASECKHSELHIDTSSVFVEVLDESGQPAPPGVMGELVLSSDRNAVMPLTRYRSGDRGSLVFEKCECGTATPRIMKLDGRMIKCFKLPSGELFPPTRFNDMFARFPELREIQITELDVGVFQVDAELSPNAKDVDGTLSRVKYHVLEAIPGSAVQVGIASFRSDSKFQRYRSHL